MNVLDRKPEALLDGLIQIGDTEGVFITADHHFGHANIIKFCDRPFSYVEEMDTALIENWNSVIREDDSVYHLGDFTLGGYTDANHYFGLLNGQIHILKNIWHHDKRWITRPLRTLKSKSNHPVVFLPPMVVMEVPCLGRDNYPLAITLCHYPVAVWDRKHFGAWCLHGHSHGKYQSNEFIIDVGVDAMNYCPISLSGVLTLMFERNWN
jgi:calcineurin-like phosphoesterase family protein